MTLIFDFCKTLGQSGPSNNFSNRYGLTAEAIGLISSLLNVASPRDVPFHQLLQPKCLHYGSTKAYLCSPLFSILFSTTA